MDDIINSIADTSGAEWVMHWGEAHPRKPAREVEFESGIALAHLLMNEVVFLNSNWWQKEWPEDAKQMISINVNCSDVFAWACSDSEGLAYNEIENLYRLWRACPAWGAAKWCCLQRKQKPQPPVERRMKSAGVWDELMETLGENTQDAEVQAYFAAFCAARREETLASDVGKN